MLESFERSVVVYTAMEDSKFAEDLATIVKQLFDWKERVLKMNGMIVDRYKPSF